MNSKCFHITWILLLTVKSLCKAEYCRSKIGLFHEDVFNLHSCAWCYYFLFPAHAYKPHSNDHYLVLDSGAINESSGIQVVADIDNQTASETICLSLTPDQCERWRLCCLAARACCRRQLESHDYDVNSTCHSTWDGYSCWDKGSPGETSHNSCPNFLQYSIPTRYALKTCQGNGTWLKKGPRDQEWTDYRPCLNYEELRTTIYISLGCQVASLLCLIPSVLVFISYKALLRQYRIRIHVNFFLSFIFSGVFTILWNSAITYEKITTSNVSDTHLYKNSVECRLLSFVKIYFTSTNYVWMYCEGLYLYRLVNNAFSPPKSLLFFYLFGWGFPLIYSTAYGFVQLFESNESCWSKNVGYKQWIIYAPNLFCLVANVYFLSSILRVLLTQLQNHPNEPSNFRKALRATFVLIPLFGMQLVVTIYRLPPEASAAMYYERFSEFISNSQGLFVAVIFCLCNLEVLSLMKRTWVRRLSTFDVTSKRGNSGISLNAYNNTFNSRYQSSLKTSPNRGLIACLKVEQSDLTSQV